MELYHGSSNKFNKFDYSKIRTNGTSEGLGFYFTDSKEIASQYGDNGYLYTVKLNINKSLSDNNKTISKNVLRHYIIKLQNYTDYLSNFGDVNYEGYKNVLNMAVNDTYDFCDTDTEIMGSIYNSCGEDENVITLFYTLLGYDYILSIPEWGKQKLYIVLTNDIIDIVKIEKL